MRLHIHGKTFSRQQLSNFRRHRLKGNGALENRKLLLQRFCAFDGTRCLVINNQGDQACAVAPQSGIQREMFQWCVWAGSNLMAASISG